MTPRRGAAPPARRRRSRASADRTGWPTIGATNRSRSRRASSRNCAGPDCARAALASSGSMAASTTRRAAQAAGQEVRPRDGPCRRVREIDAADDLGRQPRHGRHAPTGTVSRGTPPSERSRPVRAAGPCAGASRPSCRPGREFERQRAAVRLDDAARGGQPEARPAVLRRVERFEGVGPMLGGDARARSRSPAGRSTPSTIAPPGAPAPRPSIACTLLRMRLRSTSFSCAGSASSTRPWDRCGCRCRCSFGIVLQQRHRLDQQPLDRHVPAPPAAAAAQRAADPGRCR